jgi:diguanylate cyclase (GGDEF)-like protein
MTAWLVSAWRARRRHRVEGVAASLSLSTVLPAVGGIVITVLLWFLAWRSRDSSLSPAGYALFVGSAATLATSVVAVLQRQVGGSTRDQLAEIAHRATHDELTGLPNREELHQRLEAALVDGYRHDRIVGVLFLDLDGFKAVNDRFGHGVGDDLLKAFGERLRDVVRANDVVARFGGDEFVVVCQGATRESAIEEIAANIRRAFEQPLRFGRREQAIAPSIGVAVASRRNPATPVELISHADQAMYRAKREHAGVRVFDDAQRREVLDRREVERALVPALAEGQFCVHYQPIVSVSDSRVVALEALLRWKHPIHGVIGAERFLPVAEESGILSRLSDMVLRESTGQMSLWNRLHPAAADPGHPDPGLSVGINVAEGQLVDPAFPDRLAEVLEWAGLPASRLSLEIGEELLLRRAPDSADALRRLSQVGVGLVVDDFGTSRAALARTRNLDLVDQLKIDDSLVSAMVTDDVARAVVEASVSLARSLGLQAMAEGVETIEQKQMLASMGIDHMQGFLFLRPVTAEDLMSSGMIGSSALEGIGIE